jgi:hypothetical protein
VFNESVFMSCVASNGSFSYIGRLFECFAFLTLLVALCNVFSRFAFSRAVQRLKRHPIELTHIQILYNGRRRRHDGSPASSTTLSSASSPLCSLV